ncbi:MAG TPA: F0F1 ATP synthase subunit B [Candidatus Peribacteria bacterium]|nr:F0F1 ATP synthase subunit B [Candidatus Peribacteria bacterium]
MTELIHALGIDWYALLAQVVNFAILIFVLTKLVYKPVLKVIDQRRATIEKSLEEARDIARSKELLEKQRADVLRKADLEAGKLLERAKQEADAIRNEIEKEARAHSKLIVTKGMQQLESERTKMVADIQTKLAHAIVQSAEKILRREFSKEDQKQFEAELKENLPSMLA